MKCAIICFSNLVSVPYLHKYTDLLNENTIVYDVIYWNRDSINETCIDNNVYIYNLKLNAAENKISKFICMMSYIAFCKKVIKKNKYDKLIILTTLPAVLMSHFLLKNYMKNYILDIRDHSYEHIKFYFKIVEKLVNNSLANVISSSGFKKFLPKSNYIICHNLNIDDEGEKTLKKVNYKEKINIAFIGQIRYMDAYKDFLIHVSNSNKLILHFYGFGIDVSLLKKFVLENNLKNIMFHGKYLPNEKVEILRNVDVLFNAYGNDLHVKYLLSNKYYDALQFKKPILVSPGTTMQEMSGELSYAVDKDFNELEFLTWYRNIDKAKFNKLCEKKLSLIKEENEHFNDEIINLMKK